MNKSKLYRSKASQGMALLFVDGLFFGMTDPARAPSFFFIIAYLLASCSLYWMATNLYKLAVWQGVPLKHQKRAVLSSTGVLMTVLALQSMGQLSPRDVVIALPLSVLGYLYISYSKKSPLNNT